MRRRRVVWRLWEVEHIACRPCSRRLSFPLHPKSAPELAMIGLDRTCWLSWRSRDFIEFHRVSSCVPSEFEQTLRRGWRSVLLPRQIVELCDGASLAGAQVLEIERSDEIVVGPDMFRYKVDLKMFIQYLHISQGVCCGYLEWTVNFWARFRPVGLFLAALFRWCQVDD